MRRGRPIRGSPAAAPPAAGPRGASSPSAPTLGAGGHEESADDMRAHSADLVLVAGRIDRGAQEHGVPAPCGAAAHRRSPPPGRRSGSQDIAVPDVRGPGDEPLGPHRLVPVLLRVPEQSLQPHPADVEGRLGRGRGTKRLLGAGCTGTVPLSGCASRRRLRPPGSERRPSGSAAVPCPKGLRTPWKASRCRSRSGFRVADRASLLVQVPQAERAVAASRFGSRRISIGEPGHVAVRFPLGTSNSLSRSRATSPSARRTPMSKGEEKREEIRSQSVRELPHSDDTS